MDSSSTIDSPSSSDCHMGDDEFERFIVINLVLWRQMLNMAFDARAMCLAIVSDSD